MKIKPSLNSLLRMCYSFHHHFYDYIINISSFYKQFDLKYKFTVTLLKYNIITTIYMLQYKKIKCIKI